MKLSIAVFFGGQSCEHEISCITGNQVLQAINKDKYDVVPVYVSKNLDLYTGDALFDLSEYASLNALITKLDKVSLVKDSNKVTLEKVKRSLFNKGIKVDLAILAMHGTNGEDGTLQGLLEMMKLPYTSSNVLGSAISQDKDIMKKVLSYDNIPMVPWFSFYSFDFKDDYDLILSKAKDLGFPLIAKPANLGSSIGIEIIHDESEFKTKIVETMKYDEKIVVEKMITNLKEVNCSVLGSIRNAKASVIEEVLKNDEILTFDDKYSGSKGSKATKLKTSTKGSKGMASTSRKVPANISEKQSLLIKDLSIKVFKALNANGVVRIDYMIDMDNDEVYVNEINSIPGSMAFYLWNEEGIDFEKLCETLISNALDSYRIKEKMVHSFDTNILSNFRRK